MRLGVPVRVGERPAVRRARAAALPAHHRARRSVRVPLGHRPGDEPVRAGADAAARRAASSTSPTRPRTHGGATSTRRCSTTASTRSRATSASRCRATRSRSTATTARACTTSTRSSTTSASTTRPRASSAKDAGPPIVWSRAGWAASQRHPIGWGGDPQSDWEGLAASIRGGLSHGMSGNPYHSSDIGGFYGAEQPDAELYLRWLQATVFCSHIRMHGIGEREPWAFGPEAEAIARKWLAFRYRLIPYLERVDRAGDAHRAAGDARDAARLPGQSAHAALRDAVPVRRGAALSRRSSRRAARSTSRCRPARGTTSTRARATPAARCCATARRSTSSRCSAARATRCRSAARCSTPARSTPRTRSSSCGCSARPRNSLDGFTQARIEADGEGGFTLRTSPGVEVVALRRVSAAMTQAPPAIAITSGEPAGIGPELCAMLAARHERQPFGARLVVFGDREVLAARAARIGLSPRYADYDPASFAPGGGVIEVCHQPLAAPPVARPSRSHQRRERARDAAPCLRRLRGRRVRRAGHRAGAEERDPRRGARLRRAHRVLRRAHRHAARGHDAGRRRQPTRRCASRWSRRTSRSPTCRPR